MGQKEKFVTFKKIGMTHKDFYYLFVLHQLQQEDLHAAVLFQRLHETFPEKSLSRAHFYNTVREMADTYQWITARREGKKLIYSLTPHGLDKYRSYSQQFFQRFATMKDTAHNFLTFMSNKQQEEPSFPPLSLEEQRFFSRLIKVRDIVRYFMLRHLIQKRSVYGFELYQWLKEKFGWQSSEAYLYELLHEMEAFLWIEGKWDDPERRRKKLYRISKEGLDAYPTVEQKAFATVSSVHTFMKEILSILPNTNEQNVVQKLKKLQKL